MFWPFHMRMTKKLKERLQDIFANRMFRLGFDGERTIRPGMMVSAWSDYLESIGCSRVHGRRAPKGFVRIEDPIWHGDQILVPRDLAVKTLALEWLP